MSSPSNANPDAERSPVSDWRDVHAHLHKRARAGGVVILALAGVLLGLNVSWVMRNLDSIRPISTGDVAPLFTVPAVDERGRISRDDGIRLLDLRGHVVVIDFWATWCAPCKQSMPAVERVYRRYRDRGMKMISLNTDHPAKARRLMQVSGYTMPLYVDDGRVSDDYKVTSIPHLVVIDKHGIIRHVHRGFQGESTLDEQVSSLLDD